jgi:ABC-type uncharacterized transport system YnjBCD permease subunit
MAMSTPYPIQLDFTAEPRIARWRPFVQWVLAIPHLAIASVLSSLRHLLIAISLVTVLFTKRIPPPGVRHHRDDVPVRMAVGELCVLPVAQRRPADWSTGDHFARVIP